MQYFLLMNGNRQKELKNLHQQIIDIETNGMEYGINNTLLSQKKTELLEKVKQVQLRIGQEDKYVIQTFNTCEKTILWISGISTIIILFWGIKEVYFNT